MPYPGSTDTLTLTVDPYDGSTAATVTLKAPDGTTTGPTPVSTDGRHTWSATSAYTQAGKWVATWTVTGTGAGETQQEIWVSTLAAPSAGVPWRPELWHVADYIPGRTLVAAVTGANEQVSTFTADTRPTGDQVSRLITSACAWVLAATGDVADTLDDLARAVAAIYTAACVERGFPERQSSNRGDAITTADDLFKQAAAMRVDLVRANEAETGTDPEDPGSRLLPLYSFPEPAIFGDLDL